MRMIRNSLRRSISYCSNLLIFLSTNEVVCAAPFVGVKVTYSWVPYRLFDAREIELARVFILLRVGF